MSEFVTGFFTILGTLGGGLLTHYFEKSRRNEQMQNELMKSATVIRIEKLYEPLIRSLKPHPYEDSFWVPIEQVRSLESNLQEKIVLMGTAELKKAYFNLRSELASNPQLAETTLEINELTETLYNIAFDDIQKFQERLGYIDP